LVLVCLLQHRIGHVESDHLALWADFLGCQETIQPGAGTEIQYHFALLQGINRQGIAAASKRVEHRRRHIVTENAQFMP
jgi:hypothetical protein